MGTEIPVRNSLALLTDLYQLTMAYGYWKSGLAAHRAAFHLYFREHPFNGGFAVSCGLDPALEFLESYGFLDEDLSYLETLTGNDGTPLFEGAFLDELATTRLAVDVHAMPEGTIVFPHEPLVRIEGTLLAGQLLETPLLNIFNFQTLIATKAARICEAADGEPVYEFGLRRAQGFDGALSASRAAYIGGCEGTSNLLAGKLYGIPVRGTHAHSWVMRFDTEREAFEAYARAMPNNCLFLVDTYDTLEGVRTAIEVGRQLRADGHRLAGIRLDSGDLAWLSIEARKLLDEAGFENAVIVASNDLDERIIKSLKDQGARIGAWGVGTKLATAFDQPALGAVYKLTALARPGENWRYTIKLSEQRVKISNPGLLQVARFSRDGEYAGDAIYHEHQPPGDAVTIVDPIDPNRQRTFDASHDREELLRPVFRDGARVAPPENLETIRERGRAQLARFHSGVKRFEHPHQYPVGLERQLDELKTRLVRAARGLD